LPTNDNGFLCIWMSTIQYRTKNSEPPAGAP
jgi:hypothetical protein